MKWLLLVPFTEIGYYKLSDFLRSKPYKVLLPVPKAVCWELHSAVTYLPSSYLRVWKPVLDLILSNEVSAECYLEMNDLRNQVDFAVKVASLVIKARAYGKIDISEWISVLPIDTNPRITQWSGLLVVDRFTDYALLYERGVAVDRLLAIDIFAPTPIDLLVLAVRGTVKWRCNLLDVVRWVVKYIGEIMVQSVDLTQAYATLIRDPEYRELVRSCAPEEYILHWWMTI